MRRWRSTSAALKVTAEEGLTVSLSARSFGYIEKLEGEIRVLAARHDRTQDRLREANWAKWSR